MVARTLPRYLISVAVLLLFVKATAAEPVADLSAELARVERAMATTLNRIETETDGRRAAEKQLQVLEQRRARALDQLRSRTRALYRLMQGGSIPTGGFAAVLAHVGRVGHARRMVQADLQTLAGLRSESAEAQARLGAATGALESLRTELTLNRERKTTLEAAVRQSVFGQVQAPIPARRAAAPDITATTDGEQNAQGGGLYALRGRLPLPLRAARVDVRDADRAGASGLELSAEPGLAVRVVAPGRVAFVGTQQGYGQLVIVDHGETYHSLYGGLATVDVEAGDVLSDGARIGSNSREPIFLGLRRGTRVLGARYWTGL